MMWLLFYLIIAFGHLSCLRSTSWNWKETIAISVFWPVIWLLLLVTWIKDNL